MGSGPFNIIVVFFFEIGRGIKHEKQQLFLLSYLKQSIFQLGSKLEIY